MTGLTNWLGILGTGGYWFGFLVTAAFRYLLALARRFGFEGFGIRAAIHANPDLLRNVRALTIMCAVQTHFVLSGDAHAARNSLSYRYFFRTPPLCSKFVMRHRSKGVNKGTGGCGFWNLPTCPCTEYYILFARSAVTRITHRGYANAYCRAVLKRVFAHFGAGLTSLLCWGCEPTY